MILRTETSRQLKLFFLIISLTLFVLLIGHQSTNRESNGEEGILTTTTPAGPVCVCPICGHQPTIQPLPLCTTSKPSVQGTAEPPRKFDHKSLAIMQSQTKTELLEEIRKNWLKPPSKEPYEFDLAFEKPNMGSVKKLHSVVFELLQNKSKGFFVECGAYDGVDLSNTIHLEQEYDWSGLLVEADPKYFEKLTKFHRKAWSINACLGVNPMPEKVNMTRLKNQPALSKISSMNPAIRLHSEAEEFEVQCFPLASILASIGQLLNVDYFSLDAEGAELGILESIPWDHVFIKVISVEEPNDPGWKHKRILELMERQNYTTVGKIQGPWVHDYIFVNNLYASQLPYDIRDKYLPNWGKPEERYRYTND